MAHLLRLRRLAMSWSLRLPEGLPPLLATFWLACLPACVGAAGSTSGGNDAGSCQMGASSPTMAGLGALAPDLVLAATGGGSGEVAASVPNGGGPEQTCPSTGDGACLLTWCQGCAIADPTLGAGNLGPMSASVGATTVPITYDGNNGYGAVSFPSSITLGTGGIVTFRGGNGCSVPAFDVSITIPGVAVINSPVPTTDGGAAIIDTSQDLSVTWLPISIGQIQFEVLSELASNCEDVSITCTYDGASGSGVVPHALLSMLKEMSDPQSADGASEGGTADAGAPAGSSSTYTFAALSSQLETTTVVDGLIIETQSYQNPPKNSPAARDSFKVILQ